MDPVRSPLPPVAQFLAEAALQRQSALLGVGKPVAVSALVPSLVPPAAPLAGPATGPSALPVPLPADKASISTQARERLGAGFDPRGPATAGAPAGAAVVAAAAWPTTGLPAPLLRMVGALVAQLTAGAQPQRVVAAQPWPMGLAQALESGAVDGPPLQTWLVRQGSVQTPEGPRGFALTLRVPVPWLASQTPAAAVSAALQPPLQVPFAGSAQSLQSGVLALVLQGTDAPAARTSALLVLDFQPQLPATVYGRDMLQLRLDPWTQMAVLQASGQVPREEERARQGASALCATVGCPYAARAECAQPFCLAQRGVLPPEPVGPVPSA